MLRICRRKAPMISTARGFGGVPPKTRKYNRNQVTPAITGNPRWVDEKCNCGVLPKRAAVMTLGRSISPLCQSNDGAPLLTGFS